MIITGMSLVVNLCQYRRENVVTNIDQVLAYEVKKEIAERYFGFRKLIEEDIEDYGNNILESSLRLEQKIGFDLIRIYILLKEERLIHEFIILTGLEQKLFFDPYLMESPTIRKRVFAGQSVHGFTQAGRFKNMVYDTYNSLVRHINEYRESLNELAENQQTIVEEINLFYRKNDLGEIMGFLRSLDNQGLLTSSGMAGGIDTGISKGLESKLRVSPPKPVDQLLPMIQSPTPADNIRRKLGKIIDRAYQLQPDLDVKDIV